MTGVWMLLAALAVAGMVAAVTRVRDGRFRTVRAGSVTPRPAVPPPAPVEPELNPTSDVDRSRTDAGTDDGTAVGIGMAGDLAAGPDGDGGGDPGLGTELAALGVTPGPRATLLQFSTAFCAPCRATRQILADVAAAVPGVRHVEIDAESHLDLVRRLRVRRTPTVLVLDAQVREVRRASGAPPSRVAVYAALNLTVGEISTESDAPEPKAT